MIRSSVMVCNVAGCYSSGGPSIAEELEKQIKNYGLENEINVVKTGCFGLCVEGPIMIVYPDGSFYSRLQKENIEEIVREHLLKGCVVEKYLYNKTVKDGKVIPFKDTDFYKKQERIALRNCGIINPEKIEDYIANEGYLALQRCLTKNTPEEVMAIIDKANLRGRGGGGFPAGRKMKATAVEADPIKYVCVNADEGDPGAFMDRSILEGDPHSVLEAVTISGYAIGAEKGFIYVRAEYPVAVERLRKAIKQSHELGLLGESIMGTDFSFDIEVRLGSGAFVCGEGTALSNSIEGKRGEPRKRPPRLAEKGIFNRPTFLSNVETFANMVPIILKGPDWFRSIGTEASPGTKVFALGGDIVNTGLVEVPMGTTLRTIIEEIGGGIPGGKKIKAAQTGGPSGGCIPVENMDVPVDFDSLTKIGSMMGSGGLIVMDEDTCMVDIAKFYLDFTVDESCGKCTPCRVGTKRLLEILERITEGKGRPDDIDRIEELCNYIKENSLCGLGQSAPNPVLSTLKHFRKEYEEHVFDKVCRTGTCKAMIHYSIDKEKCIGCSACAKKCPVEAIHGKIKESFSIDQDKCVKCGVCFTTCKFDAVKCR
ncbi:NADH-ubiquinone oxidoreductase-F iron-sulfur binding region domain-containing protein [Anaeropeptidivorans aminofermentans]|uniref:NADH-ubiquinone oxidoreductase-F iron-sulfur binding region domain-containing protein n=1 Tax=Anaeropeptidivorans aminofermentans TaxID=2934315 RepID=UPI002023F0BB|nr:NADH-ubiquinone oxidoreductase-F iron-sulfur binding region domain-containing protein [Anaeropeptidivorans aminofermentans]